MVAEKKKSTVEHPPQLLGGTAIRPVERHGLEAIKYLIYNKETGEIFTRTPKSWFLIFLFYCIYYSLLALFWYGMLTLFLSFLDMGKPKWSGSSSIIGYNPGVGIRPSQPDISIDSSMIKLKINDRNKEASQDFESASNIDWAKRYEVFLERFNNLTNTVDCTGDEPPEEVRDGTYACRFHTDILGDCARYPFGYILPEAASDNDKVQPCVLLKINRIFGWQPEPYTDDDLDEEVETPEDQIPENVKELVKRNRQKLYLDCTGENPADKEALQAKNAISYYPQDQGISFKYFPYTQTQRNYHNAVVAVQFNNLPPGQLVHVQCKLWSKGIKHYLRDRIGLVHFELLIE